MRVVTLLTQFLITCETHRILQKGSTKGIPYTVKIDPPFKITTDLIPFSHFRIVVSLTYVGSSYVRGLCVFFLRTLNTVPDTCLFFVILFRQKNCLVVRENKKSPLYKTNKIKNFYRNTLLGPHRKDRIVEYQSKKVGNKE